MEIILNKKIPLQQVSFSLVDSDLEINQEIGEHIDKVWREVLDLRASQGRTLYDGQLFECKNIEGTDITLAQNTISYKTIVGLRTKNISQTLQLHACSLFCLLITQSGEVVFRTRDEGEWEKGIEIPGGFIVPEDNNSPVQAFINKIQHDFEHDIQHPENIYLSGIYKNNDIYEMPLVCTYTLSPNEQSLLEKHEDYSSHEITEKILDHPDLHIPTKTLLELIKKGELSL